MLMLPDESAEHTLSLATKSSMLLMDQHYRKAEKLTIPISLLSQECDTSIGQDIMLHHLSQQVTVMCHYLDNLMLPSAQIIKAISKDGQSYLRLFDSPCAHIDP